MIEYSTACLKAELLPTSTGSNLDNLAPMVGVERMEAKGESNGSSAVYAVCGENQRNQHPGGHAGAHRGKAVFQDHEVCRDPGR